MGRGETDARNTQKAELMGPGHRVCTGDKRGVKKSFDVGYLVNGDAIY